MASEAHMATFSCRSLSIRDTSLTSHGETHIESSEGEEGIGKDHGPQVCTHLERFFTVIALELRPELIVLILSLLGRLVQGRWQLL